MSFDGLYGKGMPGWIMDEIELGTRAAHFMDDEQNGIRLALLSYEVEHWHCPEGDAEHERLHDCE